MPFPATPPRHQPGQVVGGSMSLLHDLMTNTLDPGYAAAAQARAGRGAAAAGQARSRLGLGVAAGVLGTALLLTMAAVQVRRSAPAAARTHAALVAEVQRQTGALDALTSQVNRLQRETTRLRAHALSSTDAGSVVAATVNRLELAAGAVAVAGPGVEVVVDNAPAQTPGPLQPSPSSTGGGPGQVLDRDLQQLANALWAAGAEAIAINGQRLTALSSIRAAGDAILVDFRPVQAPYHLVAIGDANAVLTAFTASTTAATFRTYTQAYGMRFHVATFDHAVLPGAPGLGLHAAAPGVAPPPSSATATSPGGRK